MFLDLSKIPKKPYIVPIFQTNNSDMFSNSMVSNLVFVVYKSQL